MNLEKKIWFIYFPTIEPRFTHPKLAEVEPTNGALAFTLKHRSSPLKFSLRHTFTPTAVPQNSGLFKSMKYWIYPKKIFWYFLIIKNLPVRFLLTMVTPATVNLRLITPLLTLTSAQALN